MSSEKFTNEMINSLRYDKMTSFRDKFRNVDVLLVDDIQFLAEKDAPRKSSSTLSMRCTSHEANCDCLRSSAERAGRVEDRLRSRFEWGLIADIQPPDLETKVAILQKKAEQERVTLPTDVALYIASNIRSNVRELEGALIRLVAHSSLDRRRDQLSPTRSKCLRTSSTLRPGKSIFEQIQKAVAEQFGLRLTEIKAKNNSRAIVYPRQIAMYLAKHLTEASLPEIGRQFGGKHHTTVLHSVEKIEEQRKTDKDLNRLLGKLTEQLGG